MIFYTWMYGFHKGCYFSRMSSSIGWVRWCSAAIGSGSMDEILMKVTWLGKNFPLSFSPSSSGFRYAAFTLAFRFSFSILCSFSSLAQNRCLQLHSSTLFHDFSTRFFVVFCVRSFLLQNLLLIVRVCRLLFVIYCNFFKFGVFIRTNMIL